jgi:nucleoside-diphosphate-sugar epimerase
MNDGEEEHIIGQDDPVLITGGTGFIGSRVVVRLLERGFRNLRCLARPSGKVAGLEALALRYGKGARVEVLRGNLLLPEDAAAAARDVKLILHLAAGRGEKSYPDAFMNSVVSTRNLMEAAVRQQRLRRFVTTSSFAVYSNMNRLRSGLLDESCPLEAHPELRGDAYSFAKVRQDQIVTEYGSRFGLPWVIVRPGHVFGPGNEPITGRVGIGTFGIFLHLGGSNTIPLTYVDNCADAIVLAGLKPGIDGEVFNVVDDDLPSSRRFLSLYKRHVKPFPSLYLPHAVSYGLCYAWERYSAWSEGQLPPVFNRRKWHSMWKKTNYSNEKLKIRLGWRPVVSMEEGLKRYFTSCAGGERHA